MPVKPRSPLPLRRRLPASWSAIGLFAVVLAYVDGFWLVTLQGAVGAIERSRGPFARWLRESTLLVPFLAAAVVVALLVGRRWFAGRRPWVRQMSTVLVVVAATSTVAIAAVAASSADDYQIQARHLGLLHSFHTPTVPAPGAAGTSSGSLSACDALCDARRETIAVHVRAVELAAPVLLVTNLVLVLWLLALRGGRLGWPAGPAPVDRTDKLPTRQTPALV